ncbi:MAG: fibronectin type III domain-containing protein [Spirochaetaceae bacterium]|jgi:hypothetical protein|nr:fibronectin type III domain-containing protein [Spirochaetaceae bacterium]
MNKHGKSRLCLVLAVVALAIAVGFSGCEQENDGLLGGSDLIISSPLGDFEVRISTVSSTTIGLFWNSVKGASYYTIYRNYSLRGESKSAQYTDNSGLNPGTTYTYQVSAVNDYGEGEKVSVMGTTTDSHGGENDAIPLTTSGASGSILAGETHYYSLSVEPGVEYTIYWLDKDSYMGDEYGIGYNYYYPAWY